MGRGKGTPAVVDVDEIQRLAGADITRNNCQQLLGISWSNWRNIKADYLKVNVKIKGVSRYETHKKEVGGTTSDTVDKIVSALRRAGKECTRDDILKGAKRDLAIPVVPAKTAPNDIENSHHIPAASLTRCQWYLYHHMLSKDGEVFLLEAELVIKDDGTCSLRYPANHRQQQDVHFTGRFQYEARTRFLIIFKSQSDFKEIRVLHGDFTLLDKIHDAVWSGTDYASRPYCGYAAMSVEKFKEGYQEEVFNGLLASRHPSAVQHSVRKPVSDEVQSEAVLYNIWKIREITNKLRASKNGETISIISGCFPKSVLGEIEKSVRYLQQNLPPVNEAGKLKINILLLHYNSIAIDEVRQKYYPQRDIFDIRKRIFGQAQSLLDLGHTVRDKLVLNLALFDGWLFGSYFRFAQRIYHGPLLPAPSAINGLMITCTPQDTLIWEQLEECWTRTNEIAFDKENGTQLDWDEAPPSRPRQNKKFK